MGLYPISVVEMSEEGDGEWTGKIQMTDLRHLFIFNGHMMGPLF